MTSVRGIIVFMQGDGDDDDDDDDDYGVPRIDKYSQRWYDDVFISLYSSIYNYVAFFRIC